MAHNKRILFLFDVDGTLTPARQHIQPHVLTLLKQLRSTYTIGFVGGSDLSKQKEQLGPNVLDLFDYSFSENGLTAFKNTTPLPSQSFIQWFGEECYNEFVNFCLDYISKLNIPKKRGTFIEFRKGMINVSPIGRNCSVEERNEFEAYDNVHKIRKRFVKAIQERFPNSGLRMSIGGQISFDVFPEGWDKTYCLRHIEGEGFDEIHFFGDKCYEGGNDWEIYKDERVTGHAVKSPEDTVKLLKELFCK